MVVLRYLHSIGWRHEKRSLPSRRRLCEAGHPAGAVAAFLGITDDPLPEVLFRLEGCHYYADVQAHLLVLSSSDTPGDYLIVPDECLNSAWAQVMDDLHPADAPGSRGRARAAPG
ncbi:MAG TPA: hypothetical protein PLZ36_05490 [Armatimonadota bacterium]|nr:hypothetical protein [Armatimonadota bacterium]HOS44185.1 hypothetical protein [Armatimonadota bacterium]